MIRLQTLGSLDLTDDAGKTVHAVVQQPRRAALLVYLAIARPDRWYRRDTLLALFWPDADAERARGSLSQAVYQLRRCLWSDVIVSRGVEEVGLSPDVWCDAVELERATRDGNAEEALSLYRGAFLDGFFISDAPEFDRWVDEQRERLRRSAVEALGAAAEAEARRGDAPRAIDLARRAVAVAPTDEAALRRLLSLLVRFGDRTGAIQAYESFAARLQAEYELTPSNATRALVESIRVVQPADEHEESVASPSSTPPTRRPGARWLIPSVAGAALVCLTAWLGHRVLASTPDAIHAAPVDAHAVVDAGPSVAVLPFLNLNASRENDYFGDGLGEQLISALTRVPHLRVAARTSAFAFKGTNAGVREIGKALDVDHVVEGSVRQDGSRLLITARLIDVRSGTPVWSSTYDRRLTDIFAIQEEISRAIVASVERRLMPDSSVALVRSTNNIDSYNAFLKGRYHFNMRSPEHAMPAVHEFERAVALDSNFAAAWSGLADAYALLPYFALARAKDVLPRARAAARHAVALDSGLAEPHSTLGWIAFTYDWDWAAAEREFDAALRINPNYPDALHFYALYLSRVAGQPDRARALAERSQRVDPLAPVSHGGAGAVFYHTRDFDKSIAAHLHALALDSTYWIVRGLLAKTYVAAGRPEDAIRELRLIPPTIRGIHGGPTIMGAAYARLGMRDSALAKVNEALNRPTRPYELAILYTALGNRDAAFAALDRAVSERDPLVVCLRHEPLLDGLRGDPRFEQLAARMKLPAEAAASR